MVGEVRVIGNFDVNVRRFSPYEVKVAIDYSNKQKIKSVTVDFIIQQSIDNTRGKGLYC
jgi:hypothetical protein